MDHAAGRLQVPGPLIQADSFRHSTGVGAMAEEDVGRAMEVLPSLQVERWHKPHVVHLAAPKRYVAAVERLYARSQSTPPPQP